MGSKEEEERFKRKGIRFEQESVKKLKTSKEVPEEVKTPDEVPEEKVKEMMQLVPIEEVGRQLSQLPIFMDLLKHFDMEDLNQLWALVKESLNIRPASIDKEIKLWVELKRLYEPDVEDQLWTHTQNMMHAPIEWKLYDSDFAKSVKAISLPQDVPMNKITTTCEICSGPHDTQYCMEDPEQAFVEYASSHTDKAGDARLSKFEADFKEQQNKITNKIDTVLKANTDRIVGALPSDTVKNPKLNVSTTTSFLSARSYRTKDSQCSTHTHGSINTNTIHPKQQSDSHDNKPVETKEGEKNIPENTNTNHSASPDPFVSFITNKVQKRNSFFESLGLAHNYLAHNLYAPKGMMVT
nr:hypothetical protein [Tanacetum cinerariifolium]